MSGSKWYIDQVVLKTKEVTQAGIDRLALKVEGRAKTNVVGNNQVDTGFMLNALYTVTKGRSGYAQARGQAMSQTLSRKTGEVVNHANDMAPERMVEGKGVVAGVVSGANYSIYQEIRKSFLYAALTAERGAGSLSEAFQKRL